MNTDLTNSADARLLAALNATVTPKSVAPDLSYWDDASITKMRDVLRAVDSAVVIPDERLDEFERLADDLDALGAGTPEYAAPEAIGEGADALRALIAEVRWLCPITLRS